MTYQKNIKNIVCLQIIPNLGFGGVETGVKNIHNYLKLKGIKSFILCEKIIDPDYINDKSIFVVNRSFKNPLNYWFIRKKILKILISESINIVHISSRAPAFYFSNFFLKIKNLKFITSIHNTFKPNNLLKRYYNSSILKGDYLICNSYYVKEEILKNYEIKKNIEVIERGIDINYFSNNKIPSLSDINKIIIFNPSRISNWKGHLNLMSLYQRLDKKLQKKILFKFISNHENRYEKELDFYLKKNNIDSSVSFLIPTNDIRKYYLECDIVINSSILPEGFGRTVSESLSLKIPVIAPNLGGTKEQLEKFDKNLLFDFNSANSLELAINYVIDNYNKLTISSRKFVIENYSLNKMIHKTLDIYVK